MAHDNKDSQMHVIETKQAADTFLSMPINDDVVVRLLSVRCLESQLDNLPNQDYARIASSDERSSLCFCVCDGVGSSYKGDFAAKYLAIHLINWLQTLLEVPQTPYDLIMPFGAQLANWTRESQSELLRLDIPAETSAWQREIIEEQRTNYGSETVFLCGRIDYKKPSPSTDCRLMDALFCWMGNVTAHAFIGPGMYRVLGDRGSDRNRWSTVRGPRGIFTLRACSLHMADPLIVHTDGLDTLGRELADLDDNELQRRTRQLLQQPASDDMTLLDLRWVQRPGEKGGAA